MFRCGLGGIIIAIAPVATVGFRLPAARHAEKAVPQF